MDPAALPALPQPRYRLVSPARLRTAMERIGTGEEISGRELARRVGIPHGTIDGLLSGATRTQPAPVAQAIADTVGVALLVLWAPPSQAAPVPFAEAAAS